MDSKLIIASGIKIDKNYTNVLSYNTNDMLALVERQAEYTENNYNYIDYTKNEIMANVDYSVAMRCNYIAFQNPRHGNKWYFAFIDDVKYKAPNQCLIIFEIDVWSTFFENWTPRPCFVVREHVNNDEVGAHTVPESVTTGEYVINAHLRDNVNREKAHIIVASTIDPHMQSGEPSTSVSGTYNGIPYAFALFDCSTNSNDLNTFITKLADQQNAIQNIWLAPPWVKGKTILNWAIEPTDNPVTYDTGISPITTLDGYTPKNKKLLTYPYCYILASNNQGNDAVLKQELWKINENNEMVLRVKGVLCSGCSVRAIPINYNGDDVSNINGITLGKFPQIGFACDPYINWLTENGLNMTNNVITGVTQLASGNISGISSIANALYSNMLGERIPPQITGNINSGDLMTGMHENCFHAYRMSIKAEYAKIIDSYFDMYGYKVNELKEPDILSRPNWNYLKTINCNFTGVDIPEKDMETIKSIFDNGVTLCHHANSMYNYDADNSI